MADEDDLLDPDEIEALLRASGGGMPTPPEDNPSPADEPPPPAEPSSTGDLLDPSEIEALLQSHDAGNSNPERTSATESLLNQAEADLAAAIAPELDPQRAASSKAFENAHPFQFQEFGQPASSGAGAVGLNSLQDVELDLCIELGRAELLIQEVLKLKEGSVVPLDKLAGDPVDILVNGRLVARGEVLVLNDNFCVRVAEILDPDF